MTSNVRAYFTEDERKSIDRICSITNLYLCTLQDSVSKQPTISLEEKEEAISILINDVYLVGGAFRSVLFNKSFNDIDIGFKNQQASTYLQNFFLKYLDVLDLKVTTNNNIYLDTLYSKELEVLKTFNRISFNFDFVGDYNDVMNTFDFTCNQNYYNPLDDIILISRDIKAKILIPSSGLSKFKGAAEGYNTLFRALRFIQQENYKMTSAHFYMLQELVFDKSIINALQPLYNEIISGFSYSEASDSFGRTQHQYHYSLGTIAFNRNNLFQKAATTQTTSSPIEIRRREESARYDAAVNALLSIQQGSSLDEHSVSTGPWTTVVEPYRSIPYPNFSRDTSTNGGNN